MLMTRVDDFGFLVAALIWFPVLLWEIRQDNNSEECELATLENQNAVDGNNQAYFL